MRQGRNRPVPCQAEPDDGGTILCWLTGAIAEQQISDYYLLAEDRTRQANTRVQIEKSSTGWEVIRSATKVAELLLPAEGIPRLTLISGQEPVATIRLLVESRTGKDPSSIEQSLRLLRREKNPLIGNGPIFGTLRATYDYVDQQNQVLWTEIYYLRFFDGPSDLLLVDLRINWRATTGGIWLGRSDTDSTGHLPVLNVEIPSADRGQFVASPGRIGTEEIDGTTSPMILWVGNRMPIEGSPTSETELSLGLFVRSQSIGFPPIWQQNPNGSLRCRPNLGIGGHRSEGIRLALGECIELQYRFIVYRAKDPVAFGNDRYLDFDCPARVEVLEKEEPNEKD